MKRNLSASCKNYLKAIYYLAQKEKRIKSADIAALLGVSKASVNAAMKKLISKGIIKKELYGQVFLTSAGQEKALAVIKNL